MSASTTDKVRVWNMRIWTFVVSAAMLGWFLGKEIGDLAVLLGFVAAAIGIGEASNVGKRATFKPEAKE